MFLNNVNTKRLGMLIGAMLVYQFASDFLIHQCILKNTYMAAGAANPQLWRPMEEFGNYMPYMILGQVLLAVFFALIFVKGYEGKGIGEGVRYGLLVGMLLNAPLFIEYTVSPMPSNLLWSWFAFGLVQAVGGGIVASLVYRR